MNFNYGFLYKYCDIFKGEESLILGVCDFDPSLVAIEKRTQEKIIQENMKFDPERYAFDNFDPEGIEQADEFINWSLPSDALLSQMESLSLEENKQSDIKSEANFQFSSQERDILNSLKRVEVLQPSQLEH